MFKRQTNLIGSENLEEAIHVKQVIKYNWIDLSEYIQKHPLDIYIVLQAETKQRKKFCLVYNIISMSTMRTSLCFRSNQQLRNVDFSFLLSAHCWKWPYALFCCCLSVTIVHLRNLFLLSTLVAQMLLTPRWVSR